MEIQLLLVAPGPGSPSAATSMEAGREAFSAANISLKEVASLDEALQLPDDGRMRLLVLAGAGAGDRLLAKTALDAEKLPRWPVVALSPGEMVEAGQNGGSATLAREMAQAWQMHALEKENAKLRGDLRAIARRINHDLRSPLGGITTTAELLKELLEDSNADLVPLTTPLFDSSQAMIKLIDRVSFVARATAEDQPVASLTMGEVVWAAEQRLQRALMEKRVTIQHPESWPEAKGVAAWLEVIWGNLLGNAIRHSAEGGRVTLSWQKESLQKNGAVSGGGGYRFVVADQGPGVPPERRAALFQPFHLLHLPNSPHGLGLAIVRRLVELQGGACGVEFPAAGGAAFYFTLPAAG
jgi:signal transduction histidine kinase